MFSLEEITTNIQNWLFMKFNPTLALAIECVIVILLSISLFALLGLVLVLMERKVAARIQIRTCHPAGHAGFRAGDRVPVHRRPRGERAQGCRLRRFGCHRAEAEGGAQLRAGSRRFRDGLVFGFDHGFHFEGLTVSNSSRPPQKLWFAADGRLQGIADSLVENDDITDTQSRQLRASQLNPSQPHFNFCLHLEN